MSSCRWTGPTSRMRTTHRWNSIYSTDFSHPWSLFIFDPKFVKILYYNYISWSFKGCGQDQGRRWGDSNPGGRQGLRRMAPRARAEHLLLPLLRAPPLLREACLSCPLLVLLLLISNWRGVCTCRKPTSSCPADSGGGRGGGGRGGPTHIACSCSCFFNCSCYFFSCSCSCFFNCSCSWSSWAPLLVWVRNRRGGGDAFSSSQPCHASATCGQRSLLLRLWTRAAEPWETKGEHQLRGRGEKEAKLLTLIWVQVKPRSFGTQASKMSTTSTGSRISYKKDELVAGLQLNMTAAEMRARVGSIISLSETYIYLFVE